MTRDETLAIMTTLKTAYPLYYKNITRQEAENAINLWSEMFSDDNPMYVAMAVKSFIATDTKGFPPTIGIIKEMIFKLSGPQEMSEMEAWGYVSKALRNGIYGSAEEFAKLPPIVQKLVGNPETIREWSMMPTDELQTVVQSNFMRSYRTRAKSEKELQMIPSNVKNLIEHLTGGFKTIGYKEVTND